MQVTNQHIEVASASFDLFRRSDADLIRLREHFKCIAHLAKHPVNRRDSEALIAACQYEIDRRAGRLGNARFSYDAPTSRPSSQQRDSPEHLPHERKAEQ